jgi:hypothetical protein
MTFLSHAACKAIPLFVEIHGHDISVPSALMAPVKPNNSFLLIDQLGLSY